ncbi:MAG: hypothetical protein IPH23_02295 [Gammaproteobacteria bacterium]|nr:hypothetical protein [Gammaproteobacteria bacterium]
MPTSRHDGGNDTRRIGFQLGVLRLIVGKVQFRPRLIVRARASMVALFLFVDRRYH